MAAPGKSSPAGAAAGLTVTQAANSDADFTLTVTATSTDGGSTASAGGTIAVTVNAVADAPSLTASDTTGAEDSAIPPTIASALVDGDGSESLAIVVSGVPAGRGALGRHRSRRRGVGPTAAQLSGLTITPPANDFSDFTLTVTATATEAAGGACGEQQRRRST